MANQTDNFNPFEAKLEAAFRPVHPSSNYVQAIRRRIDFTAPVQVTRRLSNPPSLLMILGGVLSVSLLIITTVRAIFYFTHRSKA